MVHGSLFWLVPGSYTVMIRASTFQLKALVPVKNTDVQSRDANGTQRSKSEFRRLEGDKNKTLSP